MRITQLLKFLLIAAILTFAACNTYVNVAINDISKGTWASIETIDGSLPTARHEAAFIGLDDKIYLIGGRGIKPVNIYDINTKKWQVGAGTPIELHHFQPVVYEDEVYIIGAMTGKYPGEIPVEDIYVYNPKTNIWRIEGNIPKERARGGAGVVIHNDMLYVVCGIKDGHRGDHKKWLDRYDLKKKTWTQLPDAPLARDHFQAAVTRGKIYALAGRTTIAADNPFKHTIGTVDVYDIEDQEWNTLSNELPTWRAGNAVHVIEDEILVIGGESFTQKPAHNEVEALNVITKKWRTLPAIPKGRHGTGLVKYKDALYIASGSGDRGGGPELNDLWVYEY